MSMDRHHDDEWFRQTAGQIGLDDYHVCDEDDEAVMNGQALSTLYSTTGNGRFVHIADSDISHHGARNTKRGHVHERLGLCTDNGKLGRNRHGERNTKPGNVHARLGPRPLESDHSKRRSVSDAITCNKLEMDRGSDNTLSNQPTRGRKETDFPRAVGRSEVDYSDVRFDTIVGPEKIEIGASSLSFSPETQSSSNVFNNRESKRGQEEGDGLSVYESDVLRDNNVVVSDRSKDPRCSEFLPSRHGAQLLKNGMPVRDSPDQRARRRERREKGKHHRHGRKGRSRERHGSHSVRDRNRDRDRSRSRIRRGSPDRAERYTSEWCQGSGSNRNDSNSDDSRVSVNRYQSNGPRMRSPWSDNDHSYQDDQSMREENHVYYNSELSKTSNINKDDKNLNSTTNVDLTQLRYSKVDGSKSAGNGHVDRLNPNQGIRFPSEEGKYKSTPVNNSGRSYYSPISDKEESNLGVHSSSSTIGRLHNSDIRNANNVMPPLPGEVCINGIEGFLPNVVCMVMRYQNHTSVELIFNKVEEVFPDMKRRDLLEALKRRSDVFVLTNHCRINNSEAEIRDLKNVFVSVQPKLKRCTRLKCTENCDSLHVCKFYLEDNCENPFCEFEHDFASRNNLMVLEDHLLNRLDAEIVKRLLQQSEASKRMQVPAVCRYYNKNRSCDKRDNCRFLHLCQFFIKEKCRFGYNACKRSHDLTIGQPASLLKKLGFNPQSGAQKILEQLRANEGHDHTVDRKSRNEAKVKEVNPADQRESSGIQEQDRKQPTKFEDSEKENKELSESSGRVDQQRLEQFCSDREQAMPRYNRIFSSLRKLQNETPLKAFDTMPLKVERSREGHVSAGANFIPLDTSNDTTSHTMEKCSFKKESKEECEIIPEAEVNVSNTCTRRRGSRLAGDDALSNTDESSNKFNSPYELTDHTYCTQQEIGEIKPNTQQQTARLNDVMISLEPSSGNENDLVDTPKTHEYGFIQSHTHFSQQEEGENKTVLDLAPFYSFSCQTNAHTGLPNIDEGVGGCSEQQTYLMEWEDLRLEQETGILLGAIEEVVTQNDNLPTEKHEGSCCKSCHKKSKDDTEEEIAMAKAIEALDDDNISPGSTAEQDYNTKEEDNGKDSLSVNDDLEIASWATDISSGIPLNGGASAFGQALAAFMENFLLMMTDGFVFDNQRVRFKIYSLSAEMVEDEVIGGESPGPTLVEGQQRSVSDA